MTTEFDISCDWNAKKGCSQAGSEDLKNQIGCGIDCQFYNGGKCMQLVEAIEEGEKAKRTLEEYNATHDNPYK